MTLSPTNFVGGLRDLIITVAGGGQITVRDWFPSTHAGAIEFADGTVWDSAFIGTRVPYTWTSAGNGTYFGTDGGDSFSMGATRDSMHGEDGDDTLLGGAGYDGLFGGPGNDYLDAGLDVPAPGESDADGLSGGDGDDVLLGRAGNDTLAGDAGMDTLLGGSGEDRLEGGPGNDFLDGGAGNDWLYGGSGSVKNYERDWTSTDSTGGRSLTMASQWSPASAET